MSLNVGNMTRRHDPQADRYYFVGLLTLEQCPGQICAVPGPEKRASNSPDLIVKRRNPKVPGGWQEIGRAWFGKMKGDDGAQYVSMTIAYPGVAPVYVKAFPADQQPDDFAPDTGAGEVFNIVWSQGRSPRPAMSAPAGIGDDAIPY